MPRISLAIAAGSLIISAALAGTTAENATDAAIQNAQQALSEGRTLDADRSLREVLKSEPDHERAATMLRTLYTNYGLELPVDESAIALVRQQLGSIDRQFAQYQSRHFIVLSNAPRDWTNQRLALLERTHFQFTRVMKIMGLEAVPPRHKLICILFADHTDYDEFARRTDKVEAPWVAGYYASGSNRIVMYDDATGPTFSRAIQQIDELQKQAEEARRQARTADRSQTERAQDYARRVREHADRESERIRSLIRAASDAKAIHEAAHLIAFNAGLQSRSRRYPFWLTEGLATGFETDNATGAFGPDHPFESREKEFDARMEAGELIPLAALVTLTDIEHYESEHAGAVYAQSYALFRYLFRGHRQPLASFFRSIECEPAGLISADRQLQLFEEHFGPIDLVEREWLRFEQR